MKVLAIIEALIEDWRDQGGEGARMRPDGYRALGEQLGLEPDDVTSLVHCIGTGTLSWSIEDAIGYALLVGASLANRRRDALDLEEKVGL